MVDLLKIKVFPVSEFDKNRFDGFAIVDTQKHFGNNSMPKEIIPDFTFDHHGNKVPRSHFFDIDSDAGSTSSILLDYFLKLGLKLNRKLATAYCYAVISESKDFSRGATAKDIHHFNAFYPQSDLTILSEIKNARKPLSYFESLKRALNKYQVKNKVLTCFLGQTHSADIISEIADVFIQMEGIEYSLVIGKYKNQYLVSSRTSKRNVNLGGILHHVIKKCGTAGGHNMIAAGQFKGDPQVIMDTFINNVNIF